MGSILGLIGPEQLGLSALELENVYTLASANIDQSVPNLATIYMPMRARMNLIMGQMVKMYVTIRSQICLIMDLIGPELSELSALELENLTYLTLFTL